MVEGIHSSHQLGTMEVHHHNSHRGINSLEELIHHKDMEEDHHQGMEEDHNQGMEDHHKAMEDNHKAMEDHLQAIHLRRVMEDHHLAIHLRRAMEDLNQANIPATISLHLVKTLMDNLLNSNEKILSNDSNF